jgi:hypothetical protein
MIYPWQLKLKRLLETGNTVHVFNAAGTRIIKKINKNFYSVKFLGNKIQGRKITSIIYDEFYK